MRLIVHGDEHVSAGLQEDLQWLKKKLEERLDMNQGVGPFTQRQSRRRSVAQGNEGLQ